MPTHKMTPTGIHLSASFADTRRMLAALRVRFRSAGGQAAALFVLASTVGLVNALLPGPTNYNRPVVAVVNLVALAVGVVAAFAPWSRWKPGATLWLVPIAIGLVCVSDAYGGT